MYIMEVDRTYMAAVRTFEASVRTNSIFVGLAILLLKRKDNSAAKSVLILSILINLFIVISFFMAHRDKVSQFQKSSEYFMYYSTPLLYALVLLAIQIVILTMVIR